MMQKTRRPIRSSRAKGSLFEPLESRQLLCAVLPSAPRHLERGHFIYVSAPATAPAHPRTLPGRFFIQPKTIAGTPAGTVKGYEVGYEPLKPLPAGTRLVLVQAIQGGSAVTFPLSHVPAHIDVDASFYAANHSTSGGINPPSYLESGGRAGATPNSSQDAPFSGSYSDFYISVVAIARSTATSTSGTRSAAPDIILNAMNFTFHADTGKIEFDGWSVSGDFVPAIVEG